MLKLSTSMTPDFHKMSIVLAKMCVDGVYFSHTKVKAKKDESKRIIEEYNNRAKLKYGIYGIKTPTEKACLISDFLKLDMTVFKDHKSVGTGKECIEAGIEYYSKRGTSYEEEVEELRKLYDMGTHQGIEKAITSLEKTWSGTSLVNDEGERLYVCHPYYKQLNTHRYATKAPAVQNFQSILKECISAPAGWKVVKSDCGQLDPRVAYSTIIKDPTIKKLIMLYDDAYRGLVHYASSDKFDILEISDEDRTAVKPVALGTIYGENKKSLMKASPKFGGILHDKITNHPAYLDYRKQVEKAIKMPGDKYCHTMFGSPINITFRPAKYSGEKGRVRRNHDELVKAYMNNPVQGTGADMVCLSFNKYFDDMQQVNGLWQTCRPCIQVHDETAFYVREDLVDELKEYVVDLQSFQVDDWIPIKGDCNVGTYYVK